MNWVYSKYNQDKKFTIRSDWDRLSISVKFEIKRSKFEDITCVLTLAIDKISRLNFITFLFHIGNNIFYFILFDSQIFDNFLLFSKWKPNKWCRGIKLGISISCILQNFMMMVNFLIVSLIICLMGFICIRAIVSLIACWMSFISIWLILRHTTRVSWGIASLIICWMSLICIRAIVSLIICWIGFICIRAIVS